MVATTRKSWSSTQPAGTKPAGKWKKAAPREGGVFQHPNGKFVARKLGLSDASFDTHEQAQAHIDHANAEIEKYKKFSQV